MEQPGKQSDGLSSYDAPGLWVSVGSNNPNYLHIGTFSKVFDIGLVLTT